MPTVINGTTGINKFQDGATSSDGSVVLTVGDYGVGAFSQNPGGISDWNDLPATNGRWTAQTMANAPLGSSQWFMVDQIVHNSLYCAQTAYGITGTDTNKRMYRRFKENGAWQPWREIYTEGTVVGSITSATVGAVIERGSNANGEYVRFADGTQICTRSVETVQLSANTTTIVNYLMATSFASGSNPTVTASGYMGTAWTGDPSITGFYISANGWSYNAAIYPGSVSQVVNLQLLAVGRWY